MYVYLVVHLPELFPNDQHDAWLQIQSLVGVEYNLIQLTSTNVQYTVNTIQSTQSHTQYNKFRLDAMLNTKPCRPLAHPIAYISLIHIHILLSERSGL